MMSIGYETELTSRLGGDERVTLFTVYGFGAEGRRSRLMLGSRDNSWQREGVQSDP